MKFRYLKDGGSFVESYERHLAQFEALKDTLVFRAFGSGFFHDGEIDNIEIDPPNRNVRMNIHAPNFYIGKDDIFLGVDFICDFKGVSFFSIDRDEAGNKSEGLFFLNAEFNTLGKNSIDKLMAYDDGSFDVSSGSCEMLMNCVSGDHVEIAISFSDFMIKPANCVEYYLACEASGEDFHRFRR